MAQEYSWCNSNRVTEVNMGQQPESGFQRSIQREIEKRGGYCVKQHGSMITAVGIPDLLVCYKGMFIALEAKVDNNKPSKAQGVNLRNILKAGGFTAVVWNIKEVKAILNFIDNELMFYDNKQLGWRECLKRNNIDIGEKW